MTYPPSVRVEIPGLRRLRGDLKELGDDLGDWKDANQATGRLIVEVAEVRAPKRTGRLAASGRASRSASRVTVLWGGARVPWAGPIHYGWPAHNIAAQPFVVDAAHETEPRWLDFYMHHIDQALDRIAGERYTTPF